MLYNLRICCWWLSTADKTQSQTGTNTFASTLWFTSGAYMENKGDFYMEKKTFSSSIWLMICFQKFFQTIFISYQLGFRCTHIQQTLVVKMADYRYNFMFWDKRHLHMRSVFVFKFNSTLVFNTRHLASLTHAFTSHSQDLNWRPHDSTPASHASRQATLLLPLLYFICLAGTTL